MITIHKLKTWPVYFFAVRGRFKPFEVRKNDREFKVGDVLILQCYDPETETYNGEEEARTINYVLPGGAFGVEPGFVVLGLC